GEGWGVVGGGGGGGGKRGEGGARGPVGRLGVVVDSSQVDPVTRRRRARRGGGEVAGKVDLPVNHRSGLESPDQSVAAEAGPVGHEVERRAGHELERVRDRGRRGGVGDRYGPGLPVANGEPDHGARPAADRV